MVEKKDTSKENEDVGEHYSLVTSSSTINIMESDEMVTPVRTATTENRSSGNSDGFIVVRTKTKKKIEPKK